jgi:hypothetical protein
MPVFAHDRRATSREASDNSQRGKSFRHQFFETKRLASLANLLTSGRDLGSPFFVLQALCEIFHDFAEVNSPHKHGQ